MATDDLANVHVPDLAGRCSFLARQAGEPLPGSAAVTPAWLLVEDPGPWGREALFESSIPATTATHVGERADARGARVQLVRRPDRSSVATARRVLLADAVAGSMVDLGQHDDTSLGLLDLDAGAAVADQPVYLVCTHAKRDACCAVLGRPIVAALTAATHDAVWETSHTSGHRFAGVTIVLPWGLTYGRLAPEDVAGLVAATDRHEVLLPRYRGRSCDPPAAQVADIAIRRRTDTLGIDAVSARVLDADDHAATVRVSARGVSWDVATEAVTLDAHRPTSCGKDEEPITTWQVRSVDAAG